MASIDVNLNVKQATGGGLSSLFGGGKAKAGGAGGMMGNMLGPLIKVLGPITLIALLVKSSKSLLKMIEGFGKLLMLFLKPIGDTLATFLKPLYLLIRPIAKAFVAYFRIYQAEANKAMRAGAAYAKAGMPEKAAESFMMGFLVAMKPFFNLILLGFGELAKLLIDVILFPVQIIMEGFAALLGALGFEETAENLRNSFYEAKTAAKDWIDNGIKFIIESTDNWIFGTIDTLAVGATAVQNMQRELVNASDKTKEDINLALDKIDTMPIDEATAKLNALLGLTKNWADTLPTAGATFGKLDIPSLEKQMGPATPIPYTSWEASMEAFNLSLEKIKEVPKSTVDLETFTMNIKGNVNSSLKDSIDWVKNTGLLGTNATLFSDSISTKLTPAYDGSKASIDKIAVAVKTLDTNAASFIKTANSWKPPSSGGGGGSSTASFFMPKSSVSMSIMK